MIYHQLDQVGEEQVDLLLGQLVLVGDRRRQMLGRDDNRSLRLQGSPRVSLDGRRRRRLCRCLALGELLEAFGVIFDPALAVAVFSAMANLPGDPSEKNHATHESSKADTIVFATGSRVQSGDADEARRSGEAG